ncbi:MAG TPA: hypothetical protein VGP69_06180 [Gaiellaceae bacterium]|nr:hypothetical protein [Gaiellaceae bacterium]
MSGDPHDFAIIVTSGERRQLERLILRYGTVEQRQHLGHLVGEAVEMGTVAALAASVESPWRQPRAARPA